MGKRRTSRASKELAGVLRRSEIIDSFSSGRRKMLRGGALPLRILALRLHGPDWKRQYDPVICGEQRSDALCKPAGFGGRIREGLRDCALIEGPWGLIKSIGHKEENARSHCTAVSTHAEQALELYLHRFDLCFETMLGNLQNLIWGAPKSSPDFVTNRDQSMATHWT